MPRSSVDSLVLDWSEEDCDLLQTVELPAKVRGERAESAHTYIVAVNVLVVDFCL